MPALIGLILGGALDLGGAALGANAASNEQGAMNNAVNQDLYAQQGFAKQAGKIFNQSLAGFQPQAAAQDVAQGQQQFTNAARTLGQVGTGVASPLTGVNQANSAARQGLGATAMGNYAGYSNLPLQWSLQNTQAWPQLSVINSQAAARNALLPMALQSASQSSQGEASLGQLLGGLGGLSAGVGGLLGGLGSSMPMVSGSQMDALNAGLGPVSSTTANQGGVSLGQLLGGSIY